MIECTSAGAGHLQLLPLLLLRLLLLLFIPLHPSLSGGAYDPLPLLLCHLFSQLRLSPNLDYL